MATATIFQQYSILVATLSVMAACLLRDKLLGLYTNDTDLIAEC
jgi:hypothetical protein